MASVKLVGTKTGVETKTEKKGDDIVKTTTTTTTETYSDGSKNIKKGIKTETQKGANEKGATGGGGGWKPPDISKLPHEKVTTEKSFIQECLKRHNELRANHGSPPLELDDELCQIAQSWAQTISKKGEMAHSDFGFGENVYWTDGITLPGSVPSNAWYSEIKMFNWNNIDRKKGTGHFTQMIWKGTKKVGFAFAVGKFGTFVVAEYNPPGNFFDQFTANIGKPKKNMA